MRYHAIQPNPPPKQSETSFMIKADRQRGFKKYRIITILSGTSVVGVLLIFIAVYNASRDLELIHDVNALHGFVLSSLDLANSASRPMQGLELVSPDHYQVFILEQGKLRSLSDSSVNGAFPLDESWLEESRINDRGGHFELGGKVYTWAMMPLADTSSSVVLMHAFRETPPGILAGIYSKRLLIPGLFYIWLMIWVALIIRFLVRRLDAQNKKLEHMALHDSLTGLANRNLLEDRLHIIIEDCRRQGRTFALVNLDLNRFKQVNDTYGHEQGDELLRQFADRAQNMLRAADTFARIGGDEFIMLLHDMDTAPCISMCQRFKELASKPYRLTKAEVTIDVSIGIAIFPKHGDEASTLMRNADQAMYVSKSEGGGINIYTRSSESEEGKPVTNIRFA